MFTDFHPDVLGGISVAVADQSHELRRRGHAVTVFTAGGSTPGPASDDVITLPSLFGLSVNGFPAVMPTPAASSIVDAEFARRGPIDLVHVHTTYGVGATGVAAARRHHLPLVQTMHSRDDAFVEQTSPTPLPTAIAMRILHAALVTRRSRRDRSTHRRSGGRRHPAPPGESRAARQVWHTMIGQADAADVVIAPSHHFATAVRNHGFTGDLRVIPNGIDDDLVEVITRPGPPRVDGPLRLLWCGRLSPEKRPLTAIDAVAATRGVHLDLIGDGDQASAARTRIDRLGAADRIRLRGRLPRAEVLSAMGAYDALLFTSVGFDTQGLVLTEAVATGLPVIHCDAELAEHLPTGTAITCGSDADAIARVLSSLSADPRPLRDRLRHGRTDVTPVPDRRSGIRQSELTTQILDLYADLVGADQARRARLPSTPTDVPVAPGAVPGLGHSLVALRRGLHFIRDLGRVGPVVRLDLGTRPAYLLTTPDLIRQLGFRQAGDFHRDDLAAVMHEAIRDASNVLHGSRHETRRRALAPALRQRRLARYAITTADLSDAWAAGLPDEGVVDLATQAHGLVLETLTSTLFSADFGRPALDRVRDTVPWLLGEVIVRGALPVGLRRLRLIANHRFARRSAMLRTEIGEVVARYRTEDHDRDDVLSVLVGHSDEDSDTGLSDDEIIDELLLMVAAGVGSTASILAWVWYEVARSAPIADAVTEELSRVLGADPVRPEHLPDLVYLKRVVQETLRMWGPWISSQNADGPVTFGDDDTGRLTLPPDAMVIYSPYLVLHDPRHYSDPETFDPDRWSPGRVEHLDKRANLAFGVGERHCPGSNFAMTTILIATAALFRRWNPVVAGTRPVRPSTADFVASPSHLRVRLEARHRPAPTGSG